MSKLKAISATLVAASAIGVGGLVTAPTASALPYLGCAMLEAKADAYQDASVYWYESGYESLGNYFWNLSMDYTRAALRCYTGGQDPPRSR